MPRKDKGLSLSELGGLITESLSRAVTRPTIYGYVPHEKQIAFHTAPEKVRLYIGGNRSGKTVGGIVEDIWWLLGKHPYRKTPEPPVRGRIVTVSYIEGIEKIIKPELAKWIPPSELINGSWEDSYLKQERTLKLKNGSFVELMSYDQKLEKFAGTSRHFTHFDEEPPKDIYTECKARLVDTAGHLWITMTPVEGMTWIYDDVFLNGLQPGNNIAVISVDITENPYLATAEIEDFLSDMDDNDKKARGKGQFISIGGLVFKSFDPNVHILQRSVTPPLDWTHYASLDHGYNNPSCWLWHAVAPSGAVVTYDEIYDHERVVNSYASEIHARNAFEGRRAPDIYVGDPAIAQRNGQTGDSIQTAYVQQGIPIMLGNNNVGIGVEKMNRYLQQGKWVITGNCQNLIKQLQRVKWKVYDSAKRRHDNNVREEIHKKDDHATDAARYFFSLMPDLYVPQSVGGSDGMSPNEIVRQTLAAVTTPVGPAMYDTNLSKGPQSTEWSYIDEHMGGYW